MFSFKNIFNFADTFVGRHLKNYKPKIFYSLNHTFQFNYEVIPTTDLKGNDALLAQKAVEALEGSHSPYSNFQVGAALQLQDGRIILGANQETISYPCGTCAERTALNYAQSLCPQMPIMAIAIVARKNNTALAEKISPCGLCRQAIVEVERRQGNPIRIIMVGESQSIILSSALFLLPFAFDF